MARELDAYLDDLVARCGTPTTWQQALTMVQNAEFTLCLDRMRQYGHGNIDKFKEKGVVIRASDKLERLATLIFSDASSAAIEESIADSFGDLANYGSIGVMLMRQWWRLPVAEEEGEEDARARKDYGAYLQYGRGE